MRESRHLQGKHKTRIRKGGLSAHRVLITQMWGTGLGPFYYRIQEVRAIGLRNLKLWHTDLAPSEKYSRYLFQEFRSNKQQVFWVNT